MGYVMAASHVAPPCQSAAAKVPQVARSGSVVRHRGTCGTPYIEARLAHWRTLGVAHSTRRRTRGWRLRLAAVRSPAPTARHHTTDAHCEMNATTCDQSE